MFWLCPTTPTIAYSVLFIYYICVAYLSVAGQAYCRNKNHPIVTASTVMQVLRTARKNIAAVYRKQKNLKATRAEDDMEDKAQTRATQELLVKYMTSLAIAVEKFKLPRQSLESVDIFVLVFLIEQLWNLSSYNR